MAESVSDEGDHFIAVGNDEDDVSKAWLFATPNERCGVAFKVTDAMAKVGTGDKRIIEVVVRMRQSRPPGKTCQKG